MTYKESLQQITNGLLNEDEICSLGWECRDNNSTGNWNDFYLLFAAEILKRYNSK